MRAGGGSGSSGDNIECVGEYGETRSFHVGTLQRHYKKISDPLEEISDQKVVNLFQASEISIVR
jgi:hypothetical protein